MKYTFFIALMLFTACSPEAMPITSEEENVQPQEKPADNGQDNTGNNDPGNTTTQTKGSIVKDIVIKSAILDREMKYSVYLPANYSEQRKYPVIYLLHGYGGDQNEWFKYDDLADDADAMIASGEILEMIVVTPDGQTWMYIDNCYGNGLNYEQYFFEELMPEVENKYSISMEKGSRFIGGFSMGGYGALRYGVMHNSLFSYVYAMSSVISGYGGTDMGEIVKNYKPAYLPGITLECGDRDYFTTDNREFSRQLTALGIAHDHIERQGGHDWTFWSACTPKILKKAGDIFKANDNTQQD